MRAEERLRSLVEERWQALLAEPPSTECMFRTSELALSTPNGSVVVAVDHEGHRHLMVPMESRRRLRRGIDGPALVLRRQPLEDEDTYCVYADLACMRRDLDDLFTGLCVDVLAALEPGVEDAVRALHRVLDHWRSLFRSSADLLGPAQLAGLFGELLLLGRLLEADPGAHRLWLGPSGYRHDFSSMLAAVEVKSAVAPDGRRARIHGLDQLDPPPGGNLALVWFGLERTEHSTPGSSSVPDLVRRAMAQCDDERSLTDRLASVGYAPADEAYYQDVRFVVIEERWFLVDRDFPGLTATRLSAAGVPVTVQAVEYTVDLSGETPATMTGTAVAELIGMMLQEHE
ncbi:PD-(D/E)XK motif protein [Streptacidiphilus jiangxiensis]|uniref:Putative PD-(D/E)XK family member n=1 Tax=Streptacidiphilus jiangxiensis TaxID=235985 RepID=A0A1H7REK6_STRJI|nr:PD-(D/E)XK motif protein [Streptacidiphilus jiangxiensis]SEL58465.1 Putative PD-(D/E)XK family member [Streptacidiphilus jiangxiensis]